MRSESDTLSSGAPTTQISCFLIHAYSFQSYFFSSYRGFWRSGIHLHPASAGVRGRSRQGAVVWLYPPSGLNHTLEISRDFLMFPKQMRIPSLPFCAQSRSLCSPSPPSSHLLPTTTAFSVIMGWGKHQKIS